MTDRTVYSLSLAHLVTDLYLPVITAILPLLILTYGYSYFLAGLLVTAYNLMSSFTQPLFGWASDRHGVQIPIFISLLISAVFVGLMGFVGTYPLLLLCAALAAIGHSSFHPAALSMVSRLATNVNRGRITSIFIVGGNLGYALGPLLAGVALAAAGLPGVALLVIPALVVAVVLKWVMPAIRARSSREVQKIPSVSGTSAKRALMVLFSASTVRAWAAFAAIAFLPPYLIQEGFSLLSADLLVSGMLLAGVAGQIIGGILSDRYGRKEFVMAGLLLSIPPFLLFFFSGGIIQVISLVLFGFTLWSSFAITVAMSHEIMPEQIGFTSGLMIGVAIGAGGIGVAISGILADTFSLRAALLMLPILILAAAVLVGLMHYPWRSGRVHASASEQLRGNY
jgi:FSR family fosmidomycin resistance protein-like MFS transporter